MIRRYVAALTPLDGGAQPTHHDGYAMYAALLEAMGGEGAERLHNAADCSVSQYVVKLEGRAESLWTVNLIGAAAIELASPVIESMKSAELRTRGTKLGVEVVSRQDAANLNDSLQIPGGDMDCGRFLLRFVSPCGFRTNGEYAIFPSVSLILGSLRQRWDAVFPFSPLNDEEALAALEAGVKITGYHLRGASFKLKGVSIPAFSGVATMNARLSPPMLRLLRALLSFGTFCGVGIKTTLGMGGLEVKESPRPQ